MVAPKDNIKIDLHVLVNQDIAHCAHVSILYRYLIASSEM